MSNAITLEVFRNAEDGAPVRYRVGVVEITPEIAGKILDMGTHEEARQMVESPAGQVLFGPPPMTPRKIDLYASAAPLFKSEFDLLRDCFPAPSSIPNQAAPMSFADYPIKDKPAAPADDSDIRDYRQKLWERTPGGIDEFLNERDALKAEVERLTKAHDHQHQMAGLMLRDAERNGRERDAARAAHAEAMELLVEFDRMQSCLEVADWCKRLTQHLAKYKDANK